MTLEEIKNDITTTLTSMNLTKLLDYLNNSDFWFAPASTKYHDSDEGGLARHSYKVADNAMKISTALGVSAPIDSVHDFCILLGVCHDLCKVDFYKKDFRNVKDSTGTWIKEPCYTVKSDHTSYGHGITSYMRMINLIDDKELIDKLGIPIIYHMGSYDVSQQEEYGYNKARNDFPWLVILQTADMLSCVI